MNYDPLHERTRRHFFRDCGLGVGKIALASMLADSGSKLFGAPATSAVTESPIAPKPGHFNSTAKRVIYLFMAGAPSQLELFDYKPKLAELAGSPLPRSVIDGQRYAFIQPDAAVLGPCFSFNKHGQSGAEISEVLPHLSKVVDDIAIVRSMTTDKFNHAPAQLFVNTGNGIPGRPAMGSWLSYGLGSEANDLPSFVVLKSGGNLSGGASMWSSGFLPSTHQGVPFRESGDAILHTSNPGGLDMQSQRDSIDLIKDLNQQHASSAGDPEITTRINAYEMAYRMQSRAPELMDFGRESQATLDLYGAKPGDKKHAFANNVLLARRLAERGSRFIQVYHSGWDHHSQVRNGVANQARQTDQACAALIMDLKQRGMLEDTLVVWGGEFGRTPMVEASAALGRSQGRDHHPQGFTMWMAGGGVKGGVSVGQTDELGSTAVDNRYHVKNLHATILSLMGLNPDNLSYFFGGLDHTLVGVEGAEPIHEIMG